MNSFAEWNKLLKNVNAKTSKQKSLETRPKKDLNDVKKNLDISNKPLLKKEIGRSLQCNSRNGSESLLLKCNNRKPKQINGCESYEIYKVSCSDAIKKEKNVNVLENNTSESSILKNKPLENNTNSLGERNNTSFQDSSNRIHIQEVSMIMEECDDTTNKKVHQDIAYISNDELMKLFLRNKNGSCSNTTKITLDNDASNNVSDNANNILSSNLNAI